MWFLCFKYVDFVSQLGKLAVQTHRYKFLEKIPELVVEHNMQILDILDSVTVISFGQKIFEGTPEGMRQDPTVIQTYFGGAV